MSHYKKYNSYGVVQLRKTPSRRYNKSGVVRIRRGKEAYTDRWREISRKIKKRDGYRCTKCGSKNDLEVHHIIPISRGGKTVEINLTTLCGFCHSKQPRHNHLIRPRS